MIHEKYFKLIIEKKIKYLPTPKLLKKKRIKRKNLAQKVPILNSNPFELDSRQTTEFNEEYIKEIKKRVLTDTAKLIRR